MAKDGGGKRLLLIICKNPMQTFWCAASGFFYWVLNFVIGLETFRQMGLALQ